MCKISDKIKFCICSANIDIEELDCYWKLYTENKNKEVFVLGEAMIPTSMRDPNFIINEVTLLHRLHEVDAFDKPIKFKKNDIIEIVFNNLDEDYHKIFQYTFIYKKGIWTPETNDPIDRENRYDDSQIGFIK